MATPPPGSAGGRPYGLLFTHQAYKIKNTGIPRVTDRPIMSSTLIDVQCYRAVHTDRHSAP
jgi:hypothetical protein